MKGLSAAVAVSTAMMTVLTACASGADTPRAFERDQRAGDRLPEALRALPVEPDSTRLVWEDEGTRLFAAKGREARSVCLIPVVEGEESGASANCGTGLPITAEAPDGETYMLGSEDAPEGEWTRLAEEVWQRG